ncbi:MAG: HesA/MoeB/ThiF family protein [Deltaproteobacteria bacterium]|uniref:HesA/MoeB/ThiF family protein n=1 Tax=Candidatus Zymogenus saltonus TaxID=2844893 RepID=A0A9D8PQP8_9DELT|nr:HesA/MoeB/ThiF family protein [Candidatus Zymogenus saltonus]
MGRSKDIVGEIQKRSGIILLPDGSSIRSIGLEESIKVSKICDTPRREVEIEALSRDIVPTRYIRNLGTLGIVGQMKLLKSLVAVVGIGGLGGTVVRSLARLGVGGLILVDCDTFSEDNLNRQEMSTEKAVGRAKVEVATEEVGRINGAVDVEVVKLRAEEGELIEILKSADVAVDALDNILSRFALQRAAKALKIPLVHGSVAGFVGQVSTILPGDKGYSVIYGDEDELPERGVETGLGNLPGVVGAVASIQSVEVLKIITGLGEPLRGKQLFFDLESSVFEIFAH